MMIDKMCKKSPKKIYIFILLVIIGIIAISSSYFFFTSENTQNLEIERDSQNIINNNLSNDSPIELKGKETIINELKCLIPNSYQNGSIIIKPGINTYGTENGSIYITVYNDSKEGNAVYDGDLEYFAYGKFNKDNNPTRQNITIDGHDILYVIQHSDIRGDYRLTYFKVNDKKVMIEYLGNDITTDIENIIISFYK